MTAKVSQIATEEELTDAGSPGYVSGKRVGRALPSLRLGALPKQSGQKRQRELTLGQLDDIARSYGLPSIFSAQADDASQDAPFF